MEIWSVDKDVFFFFFFENKLIETSLSGTFSLRELLNTRQCDACLITKFTKILFHENLELYSTWSCFCMTRHINNYILYICNIYTMASKDIWQIYNLNPEISARGEAEG